MYTFNFFTAHSCRRFGCCGRSCSSSRCTASTGR